MQELGALADKARDCLCNNHPEELAELMIQNFQIRRRLYGDAVVGMTNIEAIKIAEDHGMAAKFTGSGGAIVCIRRDYMSW